MAENVEIVLGCVMGLEIHSMDENALSDFKPIVVLEYCPADEVEPDLCNGIEPLCSQTDRRDT
jgi:hypothetical protein